MSLSLNLIKLDIINLSIPCLFMAYISAPYCANVISHSLVSLTVKSEHCNVQGRC